MRISRPLAEGPCSHGRVNRAQKSNDPRLGGTAGQARLAREGSRRGVLRACLTGKTSRAVRGSSLFRDQANFLLNRIKPRRHGSSMAKDGGRHRSPMVKGECQPHRHADAQHGQAAHHRRQPHHLAKLRYPRYPSHAPKTVWFARQPGARSLVPGRRSPATTWTCEACARAWTVGIWSESDGGWSDCLCSSSWSSLTNLSGIGWVVTSSNISLRRRPTCSCTGNGGLSAPPPARAHRVMAHPCLPAALAAVVRPVCPLRL